MPAREALERCFTIIPARLQKMSTHSTTPSRCLRLLRVSAGATRTGTCTWACPDRAERAHPVLRSGADATLHTGKHEARADAAGEPGVRSRDNERYGKLIIEEDGVGPLLRLVKDGQIEGQENAARAIGLLGRDPESVEQMMISGVCSAFAKVLKEGPMKVQAMVAWAVAELAANHPKCQDAFAQNNVIRLLVSHLAFETVQEHSKYTIPSKVTSIHGAVLMNTGGSTSGSGLESAAEHHLVKHPMGHSQSKSQMHNVVQSTLAAKSGLPPANSQKTQHHQPPPPQQNQGKHVNLAGASVKGREFEDPNTKAYMKAMAAKALWHLAKGNTAICKSICESKALLCFAVLLEKATDEVQYNSAMALMEIARVAEQDPDLRRSAFKPNSPTARAVTDQFIRIVEKADYDDLLVPCIVSLGCLSRTFRATETRIIGPLVKLLDEREPIVSREAAVALTKFACTENYLHTDHSKSIISAGGSKHLVQLVYFGEQMVQIAALILLCYIAYHVPESEALAEAQVGSVLEWASKQGYMVQDPLLDTLLPEAKGRVELYNSRSTRGF
ncbi:uncharacterized protein A4U43_C08F4480 [Asparagus officinalis]|nr:uncharacterized protein A4U43_C08F4480 [Asparagus officinalis]